MFVVLFVRSACSFCLVEKEEERGGVFFLRLCYKIKCIVINDRNVCCSNFSFLTGLYREVLSLHRWL